MSLGFSLHLRWPSGLLRVFSFVKARTLVRAQKQRSAKQTHTVPRSPALGSPQSLTDGINLAAPECLASNWSYYEYVKLLLIGLGCLFGAALAIAALLRVLLTACRAPPPPPPGLAPPKRGGLLARLFPPVDRNAAALSTVRSLFKKLAALEGFIAFGVSVAYLYTVNVLAEACASNGRATQVVPQSPSPSSSSSQEPPPIRHITHLATRLAVDCYKDSDGLKLLADPSINCDSPTHKAFQRMAIGFVAGFGAGIPLVYAVGIKLLRHSARRANALPGGGQLLRRPLWQGLGDPTCRATWGVLYEPYRYSAAADDAQPGVVVRLARNSLVQGHQWDATPPATPGSAVRAAGAAATPTAATPARAAAHAGGLVSPRFVVVSPGAAYSTPRSAPSGAAAGSVAPAAAPQSGLLRLWLVRHLAPSFEALFIIQKLLLVVCTNLLPSHNNTRPLAQVGVHTAWIGVVACLRPFQRLDVRVPAVLWTPALPRRARPAPPPGGEDEALLAQGSGAAAAADPAAERDVASDAYATHRMRLCGIHFGWLWVAHVLVVDALNNLAMTTRRAPGGGASLRHGGLVSHTRLAPCSAVQIVNLASALLAGGAGEASLGAALVGVNLVNLTMNLAAWLTCVNRAGARPLRASHPPRAFVLSTLVDPPLFFLLPAAPQVRGDLGRHHGRAAGDVRAARGAQEAPWPGRRQRCAARSPALARGQGVGRPRRLLPQHRCGRGRAGAGRAGRHPALRGGARGAARRQGAPQRRRRPQAYRRGAHLRSAGPPAAVPTVLPARRPGGRRRGGGCPDWPTRGFVRRVQVGAA